MKKNFSKGLVAAGLFNILGVLTFTKGFQDFSLGEYFPELFSAWGLIGIILWGLSYLALTARYQQAPEILLVFSVEKVFYFSSWCWWQWNHFSSLPGMWAENPMACIFYSIYGPGDLAFAFFFAGLYLSGRRTMKQAQ